MLLSLALSSVPSYYLHLKLEQSKKNFVTNFSLQNMRDQIFIRHDDLLYLPEGGSLDELIPGC